MAELPTSERQNESIGDTIPLARQAELRTAYETNIAVGNQPYAGVEIRTNDEVDWIRRERGWSGGGVEAAPNFAEARFSGPRLAGVVLANAELSKADFTGANLKNAIFYEANLRKAWFSGADLTGAMLEGAIMTSAYLFRADLSDAWLSEADLRGADLSFAIMSVKTDLNAVRFDETTQFAGVVWNGTPLATIDWSEIAEIGDEHAFGDARGIKQGENITTTGGAEWLNFLQAARAYRGLSLALYAQGLLEPASKYRLREQVMLRRMLFLRRKYGAWLFSGLLNVLAGYGEQPVRTVLAYLVVIGGFADIYYILGQISGPHLPLLGAFVFSITSFHGRGFFPGSIPSLTDPLVIVAALEAIIGLFVELIFIASFTRRFLGG